MIRDQELMFSDAQALTATAISANVVDLGPLYSGNTTRGFNDNGELWLHFVVTTTLDSSGEAATLTITLESDSAVGLDSAPTVHWTTAAIAEATLAAGYEIKVKVPPGAYQRYVGLRYTVGTENFTSGAVAATMVRDVRNYQQYKSASVSNAE